MQLQSVHQSPSVFRCLSSSLKTCHHVQQEELMRLIEVRALVNTSASKPVP